MAFGIRRHELIAWQQTVRQGKIAFLTHYWIDDRFPGCRTVTKAGCADLEKLIAWGEQYNLQPEWIDHHALYPHFDLFGDHEKRILQNEGMIAQLDRFYK